MEPSRQPRRLGWHLREKEINGLFIKIQAGAVYPRREWFVFGEGGTGGGTDNSMWVLAGAGKRVGLGKAVSPGRGQCRIPGRSHRGPRPLARLQRGGEGVWRLRSPRSESSKASALTHGARSPGIREQRLTAAPRGTGVTARPASRGRDFIPLSHPRAGRLPRPRPLPSDRGGFAWRDGHSPPSRPRTGAPRRVPPGIPGTAVGGRTGACSTATRATLLQNQSGIVLE